MTNEKIKKITTIAMFAALVLISSKIEFRIAETRLHLGNTLCLLSGFLLDKYSGGLAAGLGSLFFDLLFYPNSFAFDFIWTFINKFLMAFSASICFHILKNKLSNHTINIQLFFSGLIGQTVYIVLYLTKSFIEKYFLLNMQLNAVFALLLTRFGASTINAIFSISFSILLYKTINKYFKYI